MDLRAHTGTQDRRYRERLHVGNRHQARCLEQQAGVHEPAESDERESPRADGDMMPTATATKTRTEILISGFGGQGVIRMGQILGLCAIKPGHRVTMLKSHGTETRGGYVRAQLVIAPEYVDSPVVEHADVFVAFSAPAYKKFFDHCRGK